MELLPHPVILPLAPTEADELAARRSLREQVARLERELNGLFVDSAPRSGMDWGVPGCGGPRLLSLGELERVRDELARRVAAAREDLSRRAEREEAKRIHIERMLLEPARHKWHVVRNEDIGERGCKEYRVVPRLGPVGLLLGWWRVKISSGCPLVWGRRFIRRPA